MDILQGAGTGIVILIIGFLVITTGLRILAWAMETMEDFDYQTMMEEKEERGF